MRAHEFAGSIAKLGSAEKWLRIFIAAAVMGLIMFIGFVVPAKAEGAVQISGVGAWPGVGECTRFPVDANHYTFKLAEGNLIGCVYVTVETAASSPSGAYLETGTEFYDLVGGTFGTGTFSTVYRFTGKYDASGAEIFGRCQHPIVVGSGTGAYTGVTGRLDFKDDIAAGNFPYSGHLSW